jgi:hypothetical protein
MMENFLRHIGRLRNVMPAAGREGRSARRAILLAAGLAASTTAKAAQLNFEPVYIDRAAVDSNGVALLHLASAPALNPGVNTAACSTQGYWHVAFLVTTPAGQAMLSASLAAKLAHTPTRIIGTNACTVNGNIETALVVDLLP